MNLITDLWSFTWYDIAIGHIATGILIIIITIFVGHFAYQRFINFATNITTKTKTRFDDVIIGFLKKLEWPILLMMILWEIMTFLQLPAALQGIFAKSITIISIVITVLLINTLVDFAAQQMRKKLKRNAKSNVSVFSKIIKFFIWVLALLFLLDNFGVDITGLIAGLGIGGIAVALAAQNILGDIFASISISVDEPFVEGDFIEAAGVTGTVEKIGLKTTRIRTLSGPVVSVSNATLTNANISNFEQTKARRGNIAIGIEYDTAPDTVESLPKVLEDICNKQTGIEFVRARFTSFGASSLDFELVFDSLDPSYDTLSQHIETLNMAIYREFTKQKIAFAFPTQTVHLVK